jgi:hypothetical protein
MANKRAADQNGKYLTPLQSRKYTTAFQFMTGNLEEIVPYVRPPWWISAISTQIAATKDEAADLHDRL